MMVSSLYDNNNNNVVQKSLKVKERDRKTRSFMQRLGLGPASSKQQQQPFPPPIPNQATNSIPINDTNVISNQTRPVLSSPRLLAAFGHNQGVGAPGQHPSNYPLHLVSALERAGVPLPASDLVRRSFEIPTPNEGTASMDDGVPKIRLNLSDVCSPLDLSPDPEPAAHLCIEEPKHVMSMPVVDTMPAPKSTPEIQMQTNPLQRHRRQRNSLRKKRMSKFSVSTNSTVSSSEFSLSVALAPPDCNNAINEVHNNQNLVSAYAVAHAHASALGSPLAISTTSLSVRGGMIRRAISTGNLELAHEELSPEHDKCRENHHSHVFATSKLSHSVSDVNLQFDDVLLHTPIFRTSKMDDRKRHNDNLTGKTSITENKSNKHTSLKECLTPRHKMQCKDEDQNYNRMICTENQNLTPRNAQESESPPINAGTTMTTNNTMHGTGKRKRIKSVVNMAVAAAIASQYGERDFSSQASENLKTPQTPHNTIQPKYQDAKKRYQGSPPPKCEEITSPIEAVPSTPMQYLVGPSRLSEGKMQQIGTPADTDSLRSMKILSPKCETEMKQSNSSARTATKNSGCSTAQENASSRRTLVYRTSKGLEANLVKDTPKQ